MKELKDPENFIFPDGGVMKCEEFNKVYFPLNLFMLENLACQESRNGQVKELLNFKTILTNPYKRNVGGSGRNVNVFFLLAEAMWIFSGRKDVEFLDIFNSNMKQFSDDGEVFHAPYGFRLRHWGVRSEDKYTSSNLHASQGSDQISDIIKLLTDDPETRQAVMSIWNPDLDLGVKSKDLPCNDMLMFKVREGKLHTTVQNRSNDLHWGLTTNIFQFSFLSELMSNCLGIELGTQIHNSQSLHVYEWNETSKEVVEKNTEFTLYDKVTYSKIDCNFYHTIPNNKLKEIDFYLNNIISHITTYYKTGQKESIEFSNDLNNFSKYLSDVYDLLKIYVDYKKKSLSKQEAVECLYRKDFFNKDIDIVALALNFFYTRLNMEHEFLGKL